MKLGRMNHIGVATPDLDASIAFYRDVMGATDITEPFVLESQQVRVCFVNTPTHSGMNGTQVELLRYAAAVGVYQGDIDFSDDAGDGSSDNGDFDQSDTEIPIQQRDNG